jgi:hypothetical protein
MVSHTYLDDNPTATPSDGYAISVTVTDDDGGADSDTTTVTVNNIAPSITVTGSVIDENDIATLTGSISDPGTLDTFTIEIDWGEGSPQFYTYPAGTTAFSETHQYLDDNPTGTAMDVYLANVTVTDDDTGADTKNTTVTVHNIPPTTDIYQMDQPNPQFILPMVHTLTFYGNFTDPGTMDTHTIQWEFGDGSPPVNDTLTPSHIYSIPGIFIVTLNITDDDTGFGVDTWIVNVTDEFGALSDIDDYIQNLPNESFIDNPKYRKNAFHNMILAIEDQLIDMEYRGSIRDLHRNIRAKADGFIDGNPKNDWIIDPIAQQHICMKIDDLVLYLKYLLAL